MLSAASCMRLWNSETSFGAIFFFGGAEGVKWKKPVVPGDVLVMEVEVLKFNKRFGICKATGKGFVDGQVAVEVDTMTFAQAK